MHTLHWLWHSLENLEFLFSCLLDFHNCSQVITPVTIVRGTPNRHEVFVLRLSQISYLEPVNVPFLNQLMSSGNQINSVNVTEVIGDLRSKHPSSASCVDGPVFDILRIRPHQVTERTFMWDLDLSIDCSDLINGLDLRAETTMNTEGFSINNGSDWQVIEHFSAVFPWVWVSVFSVDFVVKSVNSCDLPNVRTIIYLDSWFPLKRVILSGYLTLRQSKYSKVSTEWYPRSTKSPMKM